MVFMSTDSAKKFTMPLDIGMRHGTSRDGVQYPYSYYNPFAITNKYSMCGPLTHGYPPSFPLNVVTGDHIANTTSLLKTHFSPILSGYNSNWWRRNHDLSTRYRNANLNQYYRQLADVSNHWATNILRRYPYENQTRSEPCGCVSYGANPIDIMLRQMHHGIPVSNHLNIGQELENATKVQYERRPISPSKIAHAQFQKESVAIPSTLQSKFVLGCDSMKPASRHDHIQTCDSNASSTLNQISNAVSTNTSRSVVQLKNNKTLHRGFPKPNLEVIREPGRPNSVLESFACKVSEYDYI